jgi:MFS family permease
VRVRLRSGLLALAAGVALADGSIVTLGLPQILGDLDTTVEGVAAVIGVYTLVLALALLPLERAAGRVSVRAIGAGGLALMAAASVLCALSGDLTTLLVGRGLQALGGAGGLIAVFAMLGGGEGAGRRMWVGAAVLGTAIGPALGGVLTEVFSWQAIFVFQAPIAAVAAVAALVGPMPEHLSVPASPEPFAWRPALALAMVSAALSAVLFLLVLLLVAGWSVSPIAAAATVSVIPLGAFAGTRQHGDPRVRAAVGSALIGAGVLALAWLPNADVVWTFVPQAAAGLGMGMALTALAGELLPEHTTHDAARTLALRHAGIVVALVALAPIVAHQLDVATERAKERGVALVLDAPIAPQQKIALAPSLLAGVDAQDPRDGLQRAVAAQRHRFSGDELAAYDQIGKRADETLIAAVADAFHVAFLVTGALGLIAALLVAPWPAPRRAVPALVTAVVVAIGLPAAYAVLHDQLAPPPVRILDPCTAKRKLPQTGGLGGFLQDQALRLLDSTACKYHATREELVLALTSDAEAKRFEQEHGVDPRTIGGLLRTLIGG